MTSNHFTYNNPYILEAFSSQKWNKKNRSYNLNTLLMECHLRNHDRHNLQNFVFCLYNIRHKQRQTILAVSHMYSLTQCRIPIHVLEVIAEYLCDFKHLSLKY